MFTLFAVTYIVLYSILSFDFAIEFNSFDNPAVKLGSSLLVTVSADVVWAVDVNANVNAATFAIFFNLIKSPP